MLSGIKIDSVIILFNPLIVMLLQIVSTPPHIFTPSFVSYLSHLDSFTTSEKMSAEEDIYFSSSQKYVTFLCKWGSPGVGSRYGYFAVLGDGLLT